MIICTAPQHLFPKEFNLSSVRLTTKHKCSLSDTRDNATYRRPNANSEFPTSNIMDFSVSPCALCIVQAQLNT
ncbi:Sodium bicarbonate cotransporter 3 [Frankliniella fusca]|uniref:Sodium bicarbonate cotransporter 3 n=1 Tax=Frankliniella fusca TaxID=407009 RepID=A0AAE1H8K3_9NEOP|nr:Sodium bicarbonate cotransporter 3 [Frankliniella fusca]